MTTQLSGCIKLENIILDTSIFYFRITVRHPFQRCVKLVLVVLVKVVVMVVMIMVIGVLVKFVPTSAR